MSGILLPKHEIAAMRAKEAAARSSVNLSSDEFVTPEQIRKQVAQFATEIDTPPRPAGWRISVLMLTTPDMTDGGLHLLDEERERRSIVSPQGVVVALGAGAYQPTSTDDLRFAATGAWCKRGDRVLFQRYGGRAFRLRNGQVVITINDTDVSDVIDGGWL